MSDTFSFWRRVERLAHPRRGKGVGSNPVEQEVDLLLRFVADQKVVVDVGGHHGEWSSALLAKECPERLLIVEADAGNVAVLRSLFAGRAEVIEPALSDEYGEAALFSDQPGSGLASLHRRDLS